MSFKPIETNLLKNSRSLRKTHNPWEIKLWQHLRAKRFYNLRFRRQVVIGNYIADFSCLEKKLIIELDGGQHSEHKIHAIDVSKENFLKKQGYTILRFWNNELDGNIEGVLERIKEVAMV